MQYKMFLIKYAEIGTKGKNRYVFEEIMCKRMRARLKPLGKFEVRREYGRIFVEAFSDYDYEDVMKVLTTIFGIVGVCPVKVVEELSYEAISKAVVAHVAEEYNDKHFTFKVNARRNNKTFPKTSMELNCDLGADLLDAYPDMTVDIHKPDVFINVEVRNVTYIYSQIIPGPGGLPVGTNGKGMTLLSGGIDSPVSTYMIAKRGVRLIPVHFFSFPYTSEQAKQKVIELARLLTVYCGRMTIEVVPFTHIQEEIRAKCDEDYFTLIMRRFMMRIAQKIADANGAKAIVTGENLGQVASQTMEAMASTQAVTDLPVLQPLIGMDKEEIVRLARKIGTFETSILPYEDCCTVFTPKHPKTKPKLRDVEQIESALDIDALVEEAYAGIERIKVGD